MHTEAVVVTSNNNPPYLQACQIWPDHSQIASSGPDVQSIITMINLIKCSKAVLTVQKITFKMGVHYT